MLRVLFALMIVLGSMFSFVDYSEAACGRCNMRGSRPRVLRIFKVFRPRAMRARSNCANGSCS